MKKLLTLTTGLFLTATAANAQYLSIGPVASVGHSYVSRLATKGGNSDFKPSAALGIGLVYSTKAKFGLTTSLAVSHEGYQQEYSLPGGATYDVMVNPIYLRLNILPTYFFGDFGDHIRPKIYIGPSVAWKVDEAQDYSINEKGNGQDNLTLESDQFKGFDAGVQAGLGFNVKVTKNGWLNIDGSYYNGLVNVLEATAMKDGDDFKNKNIRLNIGLLWGL